MNKKVKHIDLENLKPFEANGQTYYFNKELPISRFREFQKLKKIIQFAGKDESDLFDDFKTIYTNINGNHLDRHKILEICHNNMHGIKYALDNVYDAVFHLAALFINRENEDPTKFDKAFSDVKIHDWEKEGFAAHDFFLLAASLVKNLTTSLQSDLNAILDNEKQTKK